MDAKIPIFFYCVETTEAITVQLHCKSFETATVVATKPPPI